MVAKVISELKSVLRLKIFAETGLRLLLVSCMTEKLILKTIINSTLRYVYIVFVSSMPILSVYSCFLSGFFFQP